MVAKRKHDDYISLLEVEDALSRGDKRHAARLLSVVLRRTPSADAWYIAARYTGDKREAIKHLQRGLLLDPNHYKCQQLLFKLGECKPTWYHLLQWELADGVASVSSRIIGLNRLSRKHQLMTVSGLAASLVVALLSVLLFAPRTVKLPISQEPPPAASVPMMSPNAVLRGFETTTLPMLEMSVTDSPHDSQRHAIRLTLAAPDNGLQVAEILVYDSVSALIRDREYFASQGASTRIVARGNTVLLYPADISFVTARNLERIYQSIAAA